MNGNFALAWSKLFLASLQSAGVKRIVVSPGSRSTPLALAALETDGLAVDVAIDERAASFFALGAAGASRSPVALLCTSGSAGAHYSPAIIEASEAFVPLIAITADRPWEAHGNGAAQTIDQTRLFGDHARGFFTLGLPDAEPAALRAARRIAAQAVAAAVGPVPGPVQVNAHFRKPLEPAASGGVDEPWSAALAQVAGDEGARHWTAPAVPPSAAALDAVERRVRRARRGLIVAGPALGFNVDAAAIAQLALRTGFPLLAESSSGLRFAATGALGAFDAFLRAPSFAALDRPDVVIQIGSAPISTGLSSWLGRTPRVVVAPWGWPDPDATACDVVQSDPSLFAAALAERLVSGTEPIDPVWSARFREAESAAWPALASSTALDEPAVARSAIGAAPAWLLVSNSRPVRDLDSFVPPSTSGPRIISRRGAAGIDGLVAGAAGTARALGTPGILLVGDVALAHDASSLALARTVESPLAILVVDNGGGRIFDELPIAKDASRAAAHERLFRTAPNLDLRALAQAYGVRYAAPTDPASLSASLSSALVTAGATLVHARVEASGVPRQLAHARVAAALGGAA